MTLDAFEKAKKIVFRIKDLQKMLDILKDHYANNIDDAPERMTSIYIRYSHTDKNSEWNVNQGNLLMLIEAFKYEIERLEEELATI